MSVENKDLEQLPVGVSYLVCTYNSAQHIDETLACLARQVAPLGLAWEVILVANACTDGTADQAAARWQRLGAPVPLRLFHEPQPGKNFAVKLAFNQACYRYACIVDDDNRLAPDYLQIGYEILTANPQVAILGGRNTGTFEVPPPDWFLEFQRCFAVGSPMTTTDGGLEQLSQGNIGPNVLWGAGMFVCVKLWQELRELNFQSLFIGRQGNKNLTAGEDDEICYVAQLLGYEVWYSPRLNLQHYMVTGRLTRAYRDRLFYSPAWAETRLMAYRSALAKPAATPDEAAQYAIKDLLYRALGVANQVVSWRFLKALGSSDSQFLMGCKRQLLIVCDGARHFRAVQNYYRQVAAFQKKVLIFNKGNI